MVRWDSEKRAWFFGFYAKFTPKSVDIFLLIRDLSVLHHVITHRRVCTISSNKEIEIHRYLNGPVLILFVAALLSRIWSVVGCGSMFLLFKPSCSRVEVCTCKFMIKVQRHVRHFIQRVQEAFVETGAIHRLDELLLVNNMVLDSDLNVGKHTRPWASYFWDS